MAMMPIKRVGTNRKVWSGSTHSRFFDNLFGKVRSMEPTGLTWLGMALALLGPGVMAFLSVPPAEKAFSLATSIPWLFVFVLLVVAVAAVARYGEKLSWPQIGLGRISWWSIPAGIALALCFIFLFGPVAAWLFGLSGTGSWTAGQRSLAALPTWYNGSIGAMRSNGCRPSREVPG
jgi:amino acid transporter